MIRFFQVAPVAAISLLLAGGQAARAQAQDGQIVNQVTVQGVKKTNAEVIRIAVAGAGIKEGQPYRSTAIADVRKAILDKGYYSDVYIKTDVTADRRVNLTIEVFENPEISLVVIKPSIVIKDKKAPTQETLQPLLGSKAGQVVNINTLREDVRIIQEQYRKAGYEAFIADIAEENVFDPKTNILTIPVTITTIAAIQIEGLNKTKPYVVTREMRSKVGDPLNRDKVQADTSRIFATNLFSDVQNPRTEPVEEGRARLIIPVQEQRTGQVQVGFGYSSQQRLTGTLEIAENNFRGRGQGVSASWTVGGIAARNQYELGFTEPWLDKNNTSLSASVYDRFIFRFNRLLSSTVTNGQSSNQYYEARRGATITLSRPVTDLTRVFATVRTEGVKANNLETNYSSLTYDQISTLQGSLVQDGRTSSIAFRSLTNTRDNERDPANGIYVSPSIELGSSRFNYQKPYVNPDYISSLKTPSITPVLSTARHQDGGFVKYNLDLRRYLNIEKTPRVTITDPKRVIATRLLLGSATGNIGFSEQYFLGGADNLRGYADDRFWGNNLALFSTELRIPLANRGDITGVLFTDIGDAWGATTDNRENIAGFLQHGNFKPHTGVGVGVRIKTPVGPVRLDYGIGETQRTHFSIGQAF